MVSAAVPPTSATARLTATSNVVASRRHFTSSRPRLTSRPEYSFKQLYAGVNRVAAMPQSLGVGRGDRVLIYIPMIPEAVFAMLATVRIGAIHSVVFGGFASASLATRIDDAKTDGDRLCRRRHADGQSGAVQAAARRGHRPRVEHKPARCCCSTVASSRCRPRRDATSTGRASRVAHDEDGAGGMGGKPARATSSTPAAPLASRRACSAIPVVTRWR